MRDGDPSGQTATPSGTVPTAMDTDQTVPWTPEEPSGPEPLDPDYVKVREWLEAPEDSVASPGILLAFDRLMARLNTAEDELALERLRADSAVGTARALRDRAERLEAAVREALALLEPEGGDMDDETRDETTGGDTPDPGTETESTVKEDTHREETTKEQPAEPGEQTSGSEDGPFEGDVKE